ncbi:MAG: hypothetical protein IJU56_09310 [Clostridia bacterium]|nr:hypothetical protein [Clostridia bacterium]
MKKALSLFLVCILLFTAMLPTFAQDAAQKMEPQSSGSVPMVRLLGDGQKIYDEDGNPVPSFVDVLSSALIGDDTDAEKDESNTQESARNILKGFAEAIIAGKYEEYYDILEKEIAEITEPMQMDENGNPRKGTGIDRGQINANKKAETTPNRKSTYKFEEYTFYYDWRRDPWEVADELDAYIDAVCKMTGHSQVGLTGRCLGANFVAAYICKYGSKHQITGFGLEAGMAYGHNAMSESISGKFQTDGDSINRYLEDYRSIYDLQTDPWITELIDFMERSHILEGMGAAVKATIYEKMVEGVTRALALATYFTIPGYWSCVNIKDYEDAMLYVFGPEGSEKREQYAGLIEKIENYHVNVRLKMEEAFNSFAAEGGNVAIVGKYGYQMTPICRSRNLVGDDYTSLQYATLGATTSEVYNTLPDDYVRAQQEKGLGKYISPDRQVDTSTCLFPDSTWVLKGVHHGNWTDLEEAILYTVCVADRQLTTDDFGYSQFIVLNRQTLAFEAMTEENCNTENWKAIDPKTEARPSKLMRFLTSLFNMFNNLLNFIRSKLG